MKRIDHVRKTVYIIVGCLTIVSLVLTICHKVGHCASSENNVGYTSFPLPFGLDSGYGLTSEQVSVLSSYDLDGLIDSANSIMNANADSVCLIDWTSSSNFIIGFYNSSWVVSPSSNSLYGCTVTIGGGSPQITQGIRWNGSSWDWWWSNAWGAPIYIGNHLTPLPNGEYSLNSGEFISFYPIYSRATEFVDSNDNIIFTSNITPSFSGHSKGGVLTNYIDSDDLIEQDSSLPTVDTTGPSDPSSNSGWFQKILNGLGKINQSIKGGVLTIGDYIGQGFENVINWLTEPFDQEAFSDELNQIALINDLSSLKTLVENCGMFDWSDVTPAQSVSFTFDFGGAVLPHTSCVIDFSWYTGTVKNLCVGVLCTFLVIGLLVTIINQLPNIIGGKSGDKGGGSDS